MNSVKVMGLILVALAFIAFALLQGSHIVDATGNNSLNATINTPVNVTLTIIGLPQGATFLYRIAPNYTTISYIITNYTTQIPIYISSSTNSTYHGAIPFQLQIAGTTITYNGVTYTMLQTKGGTCNTQLINTNNIGNFCAFYYYVSSNTLFNANQVALLDARNASIATANIIISSLQFKQTTTSYNGSMIVGGIDKTAEDQNGNITFFNTTITQAQPNCVAYINGITYNKAGTYRVGEAVINGHVGFSSATNYWLNGSLTCNNYNPLQTTTELQFGNGTIVFSNNQSTKTLTQTFSNRVPVGMDVNLVLDVQSNGNYTALDPTFIPPSQIGNYINLTISSSANAFQLMLPFNALAYQTYETSSMNNIEFFYNNGTLVKSWMEGNVLNEQQTTNLNTAKNVIFWLSINPNTINVNNVISLGFANTITNLFGGAVGEAPQLSPSYGKYDNGNSIFNFYDNFYGITLNTSKWNPVSGQTDGTTTVNNGLTLYNTAGGYIAYNTLINYPPPTNEIDIEMQVISLAATGCGYTAGQAWGGTGTVGIGTSATAQLGIQSFVSSNGCQGSLPDSGYYLYTLNASSTPAYWATYNYNTLAALKLPSQIPTIAGLTQTIIAAQASGSAVDEIAVEFYRVRTSPPSTLMPSITFSAVKQPPSAGTSPLGILIGANVIVDQGQTVQIASVATGGNTPYTYQWAATTAGGSSYLFNTANNMFQKGTTTGNAQSNTIILVTNAGTTTGLYLVNVIVTDATPLSFTSNAANILINQAESLPLLTVSNTVCDSNQYTTLTLSWSGGTPTYTTTFYNITGSKQQNQKTAVAASPVTNTLACTSVSQGNTKQYNGIITDLVSATVNSLPNSIVTAPALIAPTITGNGVFDIGQTATLTASTSSTGNEPYTYNWLIYKGSVLIANYLYTGVNSNTNVIIPNLATLGSNAYTVNIIVTDGATKPETANSILYTFTVNNALTLPTISISNSLLDAGQTMILTSTFSGGTSPYNVIYKNTTSNKVLAVYNAITTSPNTLTMLAFSATQAKSESFNVFIWDSATTNVLANAIKVTATISPALGTPTITGNGIFDIGQTASLVAAIGSTGTSPFTYNWLIYLGSSLAANYLVSNTADGNTYTPNLITLGFGSYTVNLIVTDSANVAETTNSINYPLVIYPSPSTTLSFIGGTSLIIGNSITANDIVNGGSGTDTFGWTINAVTASNTLIGSSQSYNVFTPSGTSAQPTFTLVYNVIATDTGVTTPYVMSQETNTVTVTNGVITGSTPIITAVPFPSDYGNTITITVQSNGDLLDLLYNNNLINSGTGTLTNTITASPIGTYTFNAYDTVTGLSNALTASYFVPFTVTNSLGSFEALPYFGDPTNTINGNTYYPYEISTNSPSAGITYSLNSLFIPILTVTNPTAFVNTGISVLFTSGTTLTGNIIAYNININAGVTLVSNGFYLVAVNTINWQNANIITGNSVYGANGVVGTGAVGTSLINSLSGSGGGGGFGGSSDYGGNGGNTLVNGGVGSSTANGGNGIANVPLTINNANIVIWTSNTLNYLSGASGGQGGNSGGGGGGAGGNGAMGLYIQANSVIAGNVFANGGSGKPNVDGAGGGGGAGIIIIAYSNSYTAGTYNTLGGAAGLGTFQNGGNGGNGNTVIYQYTSQPISAQLQTLQTLYTGVSSINYVPPATQVSGIYIYTMNEVQFSNSILTTLVFNVINMTDLNGGLTLTGQCLPTIQYYPNCAVFPNGANVFTNIPASWYILSDNPLNNNANFTGSNYNLDQWSNANTVFTPQIVLTYTNFAPFTANPINNPKILSITQDAYSYAVATTAPNTLYSRELVNFASFDQASFLTLNTISTVIFSSALNNYIVGSGSIVFNGVTTDNLYIPISNYQNPPVSLSQIGVTTLATNYYQEVNNYCPATYTNGQYGTWQSYSVSNSVAVSAIYTIEFFQQVTGDTMELYGVSPSSGSPTLLQTYSIGGNPFGLPLLNGVQYKFVFSQPNCGSTIYTSGFASQSNPITFSFGATANSTIITQYNITASCTYNVIGNSITCYGRDPNQVAASFTLTTIQQGIAGNGIICSNTITGYTAVMTCNNVDSQTSQYLYTVYASYKGIEQALWSNSIGNASTANFGTDGYIIGLFVILFLGLIGLRNPVIVIIADLLGLLAVTLLGFYVFSITLAAEAIIIGMILIWKLRQ